MNMLDQKFQLSERGTNLQTEFIAGLTSFLAIAYIVIVTPSLWTAAGMNFDIAYFAAIISICAGTLVMGLAANYPIIIAPGLGINVYLVYTIAMSSSWQEAVGINLVAASLFVLLSLTSFRRHFIESIPETLKVAIGIGIGFFVTFIGMQSGHLIVDSPATLVTFGSLDDPITRLTLLGLFATIVLMVLKINGAIFIGMIITGAIAFALDMMEVPSSFVSMSVSPVEAFGNFELGNIFARGFEVFSVLMLTLFDTTGTFLGVGRQAGIIKRGIIPNFQSALMADAVGSLTGGLFSGGSTSSFVESGSGVAVGGRTGLTAVFTVLFFIGLFFFAPFAKMISSVPSITAPVLILIGVFMSNGINEIDWKDLTEAIPAFLTMLIMPLSYSINIGIGIGFISYTLIQIVVGNARNIHPLMYLFSVLFIFYQFMA